MTSQYVIRILDLSKGLSHPSRLIQSCTRKFLFSSGGERGRESGKTSSSRRRKIDVDDREPDRRKAISKERVVATSSSSSCIRRRCWCSSQMSGNENALGMERRHIFMCLSRAVFILPVFLAVLREEVFRISAGLLDVQRLTRGCHGATR